MTLIAAVGQARALDGREAGMQATYQALNELGNAEPTFGIVISSYQYNAQEIISGIASLTGNMPLAGFSSTACLTAEGVHPRSVVVALISSQDVRVDVKWLAGYTQASREISQQLAGIFKTDPARPALIFTDGLNADTEQLCASLPPGSRLVGGLSSGDLHTGNAYQIGGTQFGSGGLVLTRLDGRVRVGVGYGHGWRPVGTHFRVTRSRGFWVRTLDGRPASETYSQVFGYPAREWAFPPLDQLVRLYPLGLEQEDKQVVLRSPLRVEADGSFRMNAVVEDGTEAFLLVGSLVNCQIAAEEAVKQALAGLGGARPALAVVLVDTAWQILHEGAPGADMAAVRQALGGKVPMAGGYTLGQIVPSEGESPKFLNQHMVVMILGEEEK